MKFTARVNLKACLAPDEASGEASNVAYGGRDYLLDIYYDLTKALGKQHTVEHIKKLTSGSTPEIGKYVNEVYSSVSQQEYISHLP